VPVLITESFARRKSRNPRPYRVRIATFDITGAVLTIKIEKRIKKGITKRERPIIMFAMASRCAIFLLPLSATHPTVQNIHAAPPRFVPAPSKC
jgi:hypothetical protein